MNPNQNPSTPAAPAPAVSPTPAAPTWQPVPMPNLTKGQVVTAPNGARRHFYYFDEFPQAGPMAGPMAVQSAVQSASFAQANFNAGVSANAGVRAGAPAGAVGGGPGRGNSRKHRSHDDDNGDATDADADEPSDGGAIKSAMRYSVKSGVEFRKGAFWKKWAPWIGTAIFAFMFAFPVVTGQSWNAVFSGAGSAAGSNDSRYARDVRIDSSGARGERGVNHSRDLLIEWSKKVTWKRLRLEEQEEARRAVEADR